MSSHEADFNSARWRKSSRSTAGNDCVEVAAAGGACAVRDSKNPTAGHLTFGSRTWKQFTDAMKRDAVASLYSRKHVGAQVADIARGPMNQAREQMLRLTTVCQCCRLG